MSDISKNTWIIIISCYFLVTTGQTIVGNHTFQKNLVKNPLIENLTTLDYYFFTYNVIDHNTLLVKFDLTGAILFHRTPFVYDAFLYVSKLPATNYKINIGPFEGVYEKELDGTITDHFTFCLVLMPSQQYKKFNNTLNRNNQTKTIFHKYLKSSYRRKQQQQQEQHMLHYCTKMGPDEDRYHHKKKQGSEGDRVLLLLQLMMIGIFLLVIQIAHTNKYKKYKEAIRREVAKIRQEHRSRKEHSKLPEDALEMLRFAPVIDEEEEEQEQNEEEEEEEEHEDDEDSVTLSHRRQPSPILIRKRSRSPSPSIEQAEPRTTDVSIEHILESKPWLQIPK